MVAMAPASRLSGSPRIHRDLQALGIKCSPKRVAQLMKEQHLVARKPRKFVVTTDSNHAFPVAQNLLNREYQVENVAGLDRAWAGDITYVPTAQGWLYVAVVLDLKSRKVIGWSMRDSLEQTLVHEALEMALGQRLSTQAAQRLLFHSDRGRGTLRAANTRRMTTRRSWWKAASCAA